MGRGRQGRLLKPGPSLPGAVRTPPFFITGLLSFFPSSSPGPPLPSVPGQLLPCRPLSSSLALSIGDAGPPVIVPGCISDRAA